MEEHLKAEGRGIILRNTVNRWLEYAIAAWIVGLLTLALDRWQYWNLTSLVVSLISLGCACAAVASVHNLRYIDNTRRQRILARHYTEQGARPSQPRPN